MNKTLKGIFAGCGILALLGGGLAVLKLTEPEENPDEHSGDGEEESILLWEIANSDDISKITVTPKDGDAYTATRKMEEVQDVDADGNEYTKEIANYYLDAYESLPMDTITIRTLATRSSTVSASRTIQTGTPQEDFAKYGLDQPIAVTFQVDGQENVEFLIGDISPDTSLSYLCMADDLGTVYAVPSTNVEKYREPLISYLGTTVTEALAEDDDTVVEDVLLERKDLDYDIHLSYDDFYHLDLNGGSSAAHIMVEPVRSLLNAEKSAGLTHGLFGLTASEVLTPFPTEAEMKKCGLDDPFVRVTVKTDQGDTLVFRLGNTYEAALSDGTTELRYYGYLDGTDCIYGFNQENTLFEDVEPGDITSKIVVETYVWDIGRLIYEAGDLKLDFEGVGDEQENYLVTCNGKLTDTERFRKLYTYLLKTSAEEIVLEEVTLPSEPMVSIQLERQDGTRAYNVKFYDAGGMQAYIAVNDNLSFKCRKAYVETLIRNMQIYDETDKEFTMTW